MSNNLKIRLLSKNEKLSIKIGDSLIYYRRITPAERGNIISKHTSKGVIDKEAAVIEMIQLCVTGWDYVIDDEGNEVEFQKEALDKESCPEAVLVQLEAAIISPFGTVDDEIKNS